jgi:2-succinyl-5-enolpyruvyl-6-hydroxy-3-cyclohexene-1-carboxylate synthase
VRSLAAGGLRHVVLSPGSRSTPLVLAFEAHPDVTTHVVLDERVAAFVGLGLARVEGATVALLCTSGSAGAHYLPALVEARASCVPLLAITADRPPELIDCGAPQAMRQQRLFGDHVLGFFQLGPADGRPREHWIQQATGRVLATAAGPPTGPVHLNVAFRKPLWAAALEPQGLAGSTDRCPRLLRPTGAPELPDDLLALVESADRGLIVCGPRATASPPGSASSGVHGIAALARHLEWPVLCEPSSQLRFGDHDRARVISSGDALARTPSFVDAHRPDFVLRFGQIPTSSAIQSWLAEGAAPTVLVDPAGRWHDPAHQADLLLAGDPSAVSDALRTHVSAKTSQTWLESWRNADDAAQRALNHATRSDAPWEGAVIRRLMAALPDGALLHVASSMAIRDLDTFSGSTERRVRVTANRGVNGIDGTLSTTWGEALAWAHGPVVLVCGDLAFLHDVGGLAAARGLGARATVVVLDNQGGGIFGHLPIAKHPTAFERDFLTPQETSLVALARACGLPAREVSLADLDAALGEDLGELRVIVVPIDREGSLALHADAYAAVAEALKGNEVLA